MSRDQSSRSSSSQISEEMALQLHSVLQRATQPDGSTENLNEELSLEAAQHVAPLLDLVRDLTELKLNRQLARKSTDGFRVPQRLGDFEILREIGRGGMGIVYEARQIPLDRIVALKILPRQSGEPEEVERFRREAKIAASLHHSNVVPIFAYGESDGYYYFAMQIIHGCSLNDIARRMISIPSPHTDRWIADVGIQVANALEYAHQRQTLHRDIKPSNLLLDDNGRVWVSDFGVACFFASTPDDAIGQSGTTHFQAPERRKGICDIRSEIFSVGATLLALAGAIDWAVEADQDKDENDQAMASRYSESESRRPQYLPMDLLAILNKCIHPDPDYRYASAADLASDLRRFQAARPVSARKIGWMGYLYRWTRRNPSLAAAITVIAMLMVATTGVLLDRQIRIRAMNDQLVEANEILVAHNRSLTQASFAVDAIIRQAVTNLDVADESPAENQLAEMLKGVAGHFGIEPEREFPRVLEGMMNPRLQMSTSDSLQQESDDALLAASASRRIGNVMHSLGYLPEAEAAAKYSLMKIASFESSDPLPKDRIRVLKAQIFNDLADLEESRLQYAEANRYQELALQELERESETSELDQVVTEFGRSHLGLATRWRDRYSSLRLLQRALHSLDARYELPPAEFERMSSRHRVAIRKYLITEQYNDERNSFALLLTAHCLMERAEDETSRIEDRERDFKLGFHYLNLAVTSSHWNPWYAYGLAKGINTVPLFGWRETGQVDPEIAAPVLKFSHSLLVSLGRHSTPSSEVVATLAETNYKIAMLAFLTDDHEAANHHFAAALELLDSMLASPSLESNPHLLMKKAVYHAAHALYLERSERKDPAEDARKAAFLALDTLALQNEDHFPIHEIRELIEWKLSEDVK